MNNDLTTVQSIIVFSATKGGSRKRIVFNGAIHAANVIVNDLYPHACCKEGYTTFRNDLAKSNYQIFDEATGAIELEYYKATDNDLNY